MRGDWKYPELWTPSCVAAFSPSQGCTWDILRDYSGGGKNAVLTSMDSGTDWVPSEGKLALDFDGVNDRCAGGDIGNTSITEVTVSVWLNAVTPTDALGIFVEKYYGTQIRGFLCFVDPANGQVSMDGRSGGPGNYKSSGNSTTDIRGKWRHVVGMKQDFGSAATWSIWVDGRMENSNATGEAGTLYTDRILHIGSQAPVTNYHYKGLLDDLQIFSRALSPSEIRLLSRYRGIAHERETRRRAYIPVTGTRRRQALSAL